MIDNTASYNVNYIDKAVLAAEIQEYYDTNIPTNALGTHIMMIANEMLTSQNWREYSTTWKDDMLSEAVANMWKAVMSKKVKVESAFSYLSTICWNSFRRIVGFCKGRSLGLQGYQEWARHSGFAYNMDDNAGKPLPEEAEQDIYDYCTTATDSMA